MKTLSALVLLGVVVAIHAQEPEQLPAFEVASIRPNTSGTQFFLSPFQVEPGGRFLASGATLRNLVHYAYALEPYREVEGDLPLLDESFDVTARAAEDVPLTSAGRQHFRLMLRSLLAERFGLRVRFDDREEDVYLLVLANEELGQGARPSACPADGGPAADAPSQYCGSSRVTNGVMDADGLTITRLATMLSSRLDRPVLDRTGLDGLFDVDTRFNPRDLPQSRLPPGVSLPPNQPYDDYPSIFTALQEDLGLRLESAREPVPMLVVEHAEPLTPN